MSKDNTKRKPHRCECVVCRQHPHAAVARQHRAINRLVASTDERCRRQLVGLLAQHHGDGGISLMSRITGLDRNTIARGLRELHGHGRLAPGRIRHSGAGRKPIETTNPRVSIVLDTLLEDATAGDPMTGLLWTHRSTRTLARAMRAKGIEVSPKTIARLLRQAGFSLRTNRKRLAEVGNPDRDRQFRYLTHLRKLYISRGLPAISVDTKKKELIGPYKNPGKTWRRTAQAVFAHDFPSYAEGRAIPYGIYDLAHNDGLVVVGISHDTPRFAVAAIRRWWLLVGRKRYAGKKHLLIQADAGGSNDWRKWEWKVALQSLADEFVLIITVNHHPPGASKWNRIDHRMFSLISGSWAGEPLTSYEKVLKYIRRTRSSTGFHCRAILDTKEYPTNWKVTRADKTWVCLKRCSVLPDWNYTICPHRRHPRC